MKTLSIVPLITALMLSPLALAKPSQEQRLDKMTEALNLTDQQRGQINAYMTSFSEQREQIKANCEADKSECRADMKTAKSQFKTSVKSVLTPEQQQAFNEMREKRQGKKGKCDKKKGDRDEAEKEAA